MLEKSWASLIYMASPLTGDVNRREELTGKQN